MSYTQNPRELVSSTSVNEESDGSSTEGDGDLPHHSPATSDPEPFSHLSETATSVVDKPSRATFSCTICGDSAQGRHYGVISCEGCKGFFKRTVRKKQVYTCQNGRGQCVVDRRLRNRCQYCRFQKCLQVGMSQEVVQDHYMGARRMQQRLRPRRIRRIDQLDGSGGMASVPRPSGPAFPFSYSLPSSALTFCLRKLQQADGLFVGAVLPTPQYFQTVPVSFNGIATPSMSDFLDGSCRQKADTCEQELLLAVKYVRNCPCFGDLPLADRMALVKCGWNELHLSVMASRARDSNVKQALVLSSGLSITAVEAPLFGLGGLMDRVCTELIARMVDLNIDPFEMACLRAIVLFNPDAKDLKNVEKIEACRGIIYSELEAHCYRKRPDDRTRFAKLLLRLPSLRSISLKCTSQLFFSQLFPNLPFDSILLRLLSVPQLPRDLRMIAMEVEREEYWRRMSVLFTPQNSGGWTGLPPPTSQTTWTGMAGVPNYYGHQLTPDQATSSGMTFSGLNAAGTAAAGQSVSSGSDTSYYHEPVSHDEPLSY